MDKKRIYFSLGLVLVAVLVSLVICHRVFCDEHCKSEVVEKFEKDAKAGMRLLPLDYMTEEQIAKCNDLYSVFKSSGEAIKKVEVQRSGLNLLCEDESVRGLILNNDYYPVEGGYLVVTKINDMKNLKFFDAEKCEFADNKNLLVSDKYAVVEIGGRHYVISEWFGEGKYVLYYANSSPEFDEVNCRFDVER